MPYREPGHGPRTSATEDTDSALLIDATMKHPMPPVALPKREYMENAKKLWERLGLPALKPETPWFGYSLGDWDEQWDKNALQAARSEWMDRDASYQKRRRRDAPLNSESRTVEGKATK
jgi:hypothetical protein